MSAWAKASPFLSATAAACLLAACAARPDSSRYIAVGSNRGYYLVERGSPLQAKLGYGQAPVNDTADPLHRGYGNDIIAFRFNRAGVLATPPAYITQLRPDRRVTTRLSGLVKGRSTRAEVERLFAAGNQHLPQADGGLLVYHDVAVYSPFEEMFGTSGSH